MSIAGDLAEERCERAFEVERAAFRERIAALEIALMQLTNDNLQYVARVVEVQARATDVQAERELALARVIELEAELDRYRKVAEAARNLGQRLHRNGPGPSIVYLSEPIVAELFAALAAVGMKVE